MNCPVCQSETTPVKIGGQIYCSVCGTADKQAALSPKRLSLDLSPRARGTAATDRVVPVQPAAPAAATALHQRVKPSRVIDLRNSSAHMPKPQPIVQPAHHQPAPPPKTTTHERHQAHYNDRIEQAKQIGRSPHINKFGGERLVAPVAEAETPIAPAAPAAPTMPELPAQAVAHHEAMTKLPHHAPQVPQPSQPKAGWRPHLGLSPKQGQIAATIAAAIIMAGYVWLQNYPKLALQNAGIKAGVAATLPGYLPSSYNLTRTDTRPGLVTLNFSSPSVSEVLKIDQARTAWDSSSLLDNYVAKNTDDYATVHGQGLTIYLFGQNRATWVNKGIWFSIEGTGRLSREQILKMAYSL